ncbi:MAG: M1 family aminopeptidase [Candidatus Acidiferrales bacterium]
MQNAAKLALAICLLAAASLAAHSNQAVVQTQSANSPSASPSPRQLYQLLQAVRVDGANVYAVHDLTVRRDGVTFTFADGKLAFLQPVDGRITGAVFVGRGRVFAVPPDPAERASVARFLGVPLIDTEFWQAYLRFDEGTAKEIQDGLTAQRAVASSDADFTNSWNPIVAQFNPNSSLRVLEGLLSSGPAAYFYAALNSTTLGGFDVVLDERRTETMLAGQPRHTTGVDFFDVWTSYTAANAPPHTQDFAAVDYAADTTIGDDLTLTGNTTLHLKCLAGGERILEFELSRFLQVQAVTDGDGRSLDFFQNEDMRRQEIARRGNDLLFIALPAQATEGQQYELRVSYRGTVIQDDGNGVYFVGARGSWYPHLAGSDQFASFDLKFRWPKRLRLVATGKEIESGEEDGQQTGHWRSTQPIAVAGFNLGEYVVQSVGEKPLIQLFANQQLEQGIADQLREHPPDRFSAAGRALEPLPNPAAVLKQLGTKLLDSVHYYEELNGPFPFPELDVSQIPGSFGQGWPGLLYLTTLVFLPPEAQQQAGLTQLTQEQVQQLVPFHEVVHQWWGNIVAPSSYRDVWIEEAMADYQSIMYDQKRNASKHVLQEWLLRYRDALLAKEPGTSQTVEQTGPLDFGYRLDTSKTPDAYRIIVYEKGAWVIHMLRMMLRDPRKNNPDARFDELLKNTLAEHRFQTLSTAQLENEVQRLMTPSMDLESSRSMDWFFDQWVRQTGIPEYSLSFSLRPRESRFLVEGSLEQRNVAAVFTERVPIYGAPAQGKPVFLGDVVTTGVTTPFRFTARFRPLKLEIDPEHTILCRTK